jgi:ribosome maturation factor RimP
MISKKLLVGLIEDELKNLNIYLIDIQVDNSNSIKVLLDSEKGVTVENCIKISRAIEHQLDRDEEDFALEVSSYGVFSPFKILLHYTKNLGKEVEVYLNEGKNFKGLLNKIKTSDSESTFDSIEILQKKKKKLEGKKKKVEVEEIIIVKKEEIKKVKLVPKF